MEDRHIIWSNENLDLDDWREDLQEQYPDCSEDELYRIMCETNAEYLSDERVNLNIQLSQPILVIADLGLWNGRRMGYKEIPSGNIRDCLSGGYDYTTWYVDKKGDFRCDDIHHDGTNHYLYRVYKDGVPAMSARSSNGHGAAQSSIRKITPKMCEHWRLYSPLT